MAKKTKGQAYWKRKCDAKFSKIIRVRDGVCQYPGCDSQKLQCCHLASRKFSWGRCDERNAVALCGRHHFRLDSHFREEWQTIMKELGIFEDYLDVKELIEQKRGAKMDWEALYPKLEARYNQLLKGR